MPCATSDAQACEFLSNLAATCKPHATIWPSALAGAAHPHFDCGEPTCEVEDQTTVRAAAQNNEVLRPPNGPGAHPRGAFPRQRQSGTAAAATDGSTGTSEMQRP